MLKACPSPLQSYFFANLQLNKNTRKSSSGCEEAEEGSAFFAGRGLVRVSNSFSARRSRLTFFVRSKTRCLGHLPVPKQHISP